MGEAQEHILEAPSFVPELVEDDLMLGGQRTEPLGGRPVDDHGVGGNLSEGHRHGLENGRQPWELRMRNPELVPARLLSSASVVWSTRRPCETMTTSSTVSSISERRWEDTSTACPSEA